MYISLARTVSAIKVGFIGHLTVIKVFYSRAVLQLIYIIYKLGYIRGFTLVSDNIMKVYFKYYSGRGVLRNIYMISKPSRKFYFKYRSLKGATINNFINVNGFLLISSNKGILTDVESIIIKRGGCPLLFVS